MRISATIKGIKEVIHAFEKLEVDLKKRQIEAVRDSILMIHAEAVSSLQENSDGPEQTRYKPKRVVHVSPPGTPPNTDTGRAVKSIKFDFQNDGLIGRVGTNLKYLANLEFGTKNMSPRPWLSLAVLKTAQEVARIFKNSLRGIGK